MSYITIKEASKLWGISERRITKLCNEGRIPHAKKFGWSWAIPEKTDKPIDNRHKISKTNSNNFDVQEIKYDENIIIQRKWAMPNKNTFSIKPIKELIEEEMTKGVWIDPFANNNKFASITNDLNENFDTDYHLDALDFLKLFEDQSVDGILYDPPYSPRQVSECYNDVGYNVTWDTTKATFWSNHKKEISRILKIGGKVITFGWNSGGIGKSYGFSKQKILMVPHGGWHNDTLCTVEIKLENKLQKEKESSMTQKEKYILSFQDKKLMDWIENLPKDFWDFKSNDTRELSHGFHSYPATMIYPISRNILDFISNLYEVNSLLDPFSGSGTVPVEGVLKGIPKIYANDLNPLAILLTKVKTTPISEDVLLKFNNDLQISINKTFSENTQHFKKLDAFIREEKIDIYSSKGWGNSANLILNEFISSLKLDLQIPNIKNLGYWFKPEVILSLQLIKDCIININNENVRNFYLIVFSETVRIVSNRRNGEFKMYRMPVSKLETFNPNVKNIFFDYLEDYSEKMISFYKTTHSKNNSLINYTMEDSKMLSSIPDNSIDLIITSPPYGDSKTTVAYGEFSKLSLQWLDLDVNVDVSSIDKSLMGGKKYSNGFEYLLQSPTLEKSLSEISSKDIKRSGDVYSFYEDLAKTLEVLSKKSRLNTYQFWVVGNRTVKNTYLKTDKILVELAANYNLNHITTFTRNIHNKVMPSKNSPSNKIGEKVSTMTNEFIVVLKKG